MLDGTGVTDVTTGVRGIAGAVPTGTKGNAGPKAGLECPFTNPGTGVTDSPRSEKKYQLINQLSNWSIM